MTIELSSQYDVITGEILNGNFETGDLSHWTIEDGEEYVSVNSDAAHIGSYGLEINGASPLECEIYSNYFYATDIDKITMWYKTPTLTDELEIDIYLTNGLDYYFIDKISSESPEWTQLELDISQYTGMVQLCILVYLYNNSGV